MKTVFSVMALSFFALSPLANANDDGSDLGDLVWECTPGFKEVSERHHTLKVYPFNVPNNKQPLYSIISETFYMGRPAGSDRHDVKLDLGKLSQNVTSYSNSDVSLEITEEKVPTKTKGKTKFVAAWQDLGQDLPQVFHCSSGLIDDR